MYFDRGLDFALYLSVFWFRKLYLTSRRGKRLLCRKDSCGLRQNSNGSVRFGSVCAQKPVRFGSVPVPGWFQKFFTLRAAPQTHPKWPKIVPTWHKNGAKIGVLHRPLAPKMGYPIGPRRQKWSTPSARGAKYRNENSNATKKGQTSKKTPHLVENVANIAPTWYPRWNQDGQKIDPKIDHFFDTSWDRSLKQFWWFFVTKQSQVGTKIGSKIGSKINGNFERRFFKNLAPAAAGARFSGLGCGSWEQQSIKHRSKNGPQDGMHLGIDF